MADVFVPELKFGPWRSGTRVPTAPGRFYKTISSDYNAYGALVNHILYSQEFNQTGGDFWTIGGLAGVTANQGLAPDGSLTMDQITLNSVNQAHFIYPEFGRTHPNPFTDSVFVRYNNSVRYINLIITADATEFCTYDILLGVCKTSNAAIVDAYIVDLGNGLFRLVAVWKVAGTGDTCAIFVANSYTPPRVPAFLGAGETLLLWQAQSVDGNFPDGGPIIVTGATTASL